MVILNLINRDMISFQEVHQLIGDTRIAILRFNKGRVISWLREHPAIHDQMGLTAPYAWGCLNRFLMRCFSYPPFVAVLLRGRTQDALLSPG